MTGSERRKNASRTSVCPRLDYWCSVAHVLAHVWSAAVNGQDLKRLCESLGLEKLHNRGSDITSLCPFHDERHPSFGVSIEKRYHPFNCFSCGASGNLLTMVCHLRGLRRKEGLAFIESFGSYSIPPVSAEIQPYGASRRGKDIRVPASLYAPYRIGRSKSFAWLLERGIPLELSGECDIGFDPEERRVLFPWWEPGGKFFNGATGRSMVGSSLKSKPFFGLKKGSHLFRPKMSGPYDYRKTLFVVEGEVDALRVASFGYTNVVATGGFPTRAQAEKMAEVAGVVMLAFDNDPAGKEMSRKLLSWTGEWTRFVKFKYVSDAKDPAELSKQEFEEGIDKAEFFLG